MSIHIDPHVAALFPDPDASSAMTVATQQIVAPMVVGVPLTTDERATGGGSHVVFFVFDGSNSMEPVGKLLRDGFNNDFVPAVKEASEDDITALRIGGLSFSSRCRQIWRGGPEGKTYFHPMGDLPELAVADYNPARGSSTALHQAILEGMALAVRHATDLRKQSKMSVEIDVIILSDGANNLPATLADGTVVPADDAAPIRQIIQGRKKDLVRCGFFYFQTGQGLSDPRSYAINELGFDPEWVEVFEQLPNETPDERARRFRRMVRVMSSIVGKPGLTPAIAAQAVGPDPDDDIV